jgi:hypothetical protein
VHEVFSPLKKFVVIRGLEGIKAAAADVSQSRAGTAPEAFWLRQCGFAAASLILIRVAPASPENRAAGAVDGFDHSPEIRRNDGAAV